MAVCRLCGNSDVLIDLFSALEELELQVLRYYVVLATGVQIQKEDKAPKMVCRDCCQLVEKIYQYRVNSISNNFLLKARLGSIGGAQIYPGDKNLLVECPVIEVTTTVHESVQELYKLYPSIAIPAELSECDIAPRVLLDEGEVARFFDKLHEQNDSNSIKKLNEPTSDVIVKKDVFEFDSDVDEPQPLGSLIITRLHNQDNNYEVINHITDDETSKSPTSRDCNSVAFSDTGDLEMFQKDFVKPSVDCTLVKTKMKRTRKKVADKKVQYTCQLCSKTYDTKRLEDLHRKNHLSCKFCKELITSSEDLEAHGKEKCCVNRIKRKRLASSLNEKCGDTQSDSCSQQVAPKYPETKEKTFLKLKPFESLSAKPVFNSSSARYVPPVPTQSSFQERPPPPSYFESHKSLSPYRSGLSSEVLYGKTHANAIWKGIPEISAEYTNPYRDTPVYRHPIAPHLPQTEELLRMACRNAFSLGVNFGLNSAASPRRSNPNGKFSMTPPNSFQPIYSNQNNYRQVSQNCGGTFHYSSTSPESNAFNYRREQPFYDPYSSQQAIQMQGSNSGAIPEIQQEWISYSF